MTVPTVNSYATHGVESCRTWGPASLHIIRDLSGKLRHEVHHSLRSNDSGRVRSTASPRQVQTPRSPARNLRRKVPQLSMGHLPLFCDMRWHRLFHMLWAPRPGMWGGFATGHRPFRPISSTSPLALISPPARLHAKHPETHGHPATPPTRCSAAPLLPSEATPPIPASMPCLGTREPRSKQSHKMDTLGRATSRARAQPPPAPAGSTLATVEKNNKSETMATGRHSGCGQLGRGLRTEPRNCGKADAPPTFSDSAGNIGAAARTRAPRGCGDLVGRGAHKHSLV